VILFIRLAPALWLRFIRMKPGGVPAQLDECTAFLNITPRIFNQICLSHWSLEFKQIQKNCR